MQESGSAPKWIPTQVHVERILSSGRFETFLKSSNGDFEQALRLYVWNIAISSAFWGSFHVLEVSLRNVLQAELVRSFKRDDWWNSEVRLHMDTKASIDKAVKAAQKKHKEQILPGHVIAEFSFTFWIDLLSNRYHERLWGTTLSGAFLPIQVHRKDLHRALEQLRKLRNRIAHHEPIYDRILEDDLKLIKWIIGLADYEIGEWSSERSQVSRLLAERNRRIEGSLPSIF